MPNNYFRFKKFTIFQEGAAMKVGTDGVLLGAWADTVKAPLILDIGTGTGLIAIMLAQRSDVKAVIHAVEINEKTYKLALFNVDKCPWKNNINVFYMSFQEFAIRSQVKYDHIVTNPPFFANSLPAPCKDRADARHDTGLTKEELIFGIDKILTDKGKFSVVLPISEGKTFEEKSRFMKFYPERKTYIHPTTGKNAKRVLLTFSRKEQQPRVNSFAIETLERHNYTEEYINLTGDFYLAF